MNFEHDSSWDKLTELIESGQTTKTSWNHFIDFHADIKAKPYWANLKILDFDEEQVEIKNWIESLATKNPLDNDIISIWIGINRFTTKHADEPFYAMYLVGSKDYNDNDIEWATDPKYLPDDRYFISKALNDIDEEIKEDKEDFSYLDWILPLAYNALTLTEIIDSKLDKEKFLKFQEQIFVATGHDSGDFVNLKPIEKKISSR
jgi:hypothetical protein